MAEFDDDQMKEMFGNLHDYESPSTGISWSSVEKRLPTRGLKVGGKTFLALLIPASMIIWLSVDDPKMLADAVDSATLSSKNVSPQSSSAQQALGQNAPGSANSTQGDNAGMIVEQRPTPLIESDQSLVPVESLPVSDQIALTAEPALGRSLSDASSTVVEEEAPQLQTETVNPFDSSATTVAPATGKVRRVGFSLEALYLFGIVDPLKGDNRIVQDYISKPGFGFSGSVLIPLSLRQRSSLYIVPSLHVFYKPYDFQVVEYGEETISVLDKAGKSLVAYAGVGMMWNVRSWQAGASFHVGARNDDIMFSRTLLSLSLKRDLVPVADGRLKVTVGGSIMLPVSGSGDYLKYTPITIGIGIRKP